MTIEVNAAFQSSIVNYKSSIVYYLHKALPTYAIRLIPDVEMCEYLRPNMVYEKEHLRINGRGKYHGYNFYRVAGISIAGKGK